MVSAVRPILGGTDEEIRTKTPLARVYAAYHINLMQLGHDVQWPAVIAARRTLSATWMRDMIKTATNAPIKGVCRLD